MCHAVKLSVITISPYGGGTSALRQAATHARENHIHPQARPADIEETAGTWIMAIEAKNTPSII
jgi:hypothetical protein